MSEEQVGAEDHDWIWQELAPRLIHPTQIKLIEALSWIGMPLSATEFHAVLAPSETSTDYVRYHLKVLCRSRVFIEVPDRANRHPEDLRFSFNNLADTGELSSEKAKVADQ